MNDKENKICKFLLILSILAIIVISLSGCGYFSGDYSSENYQEEYYKAMEYSKEVDKKYVDVVSGCYTPENWDDRWMSLVIWEDLELWADDQEYPFTFELIDNRVGYGDDEYPFCGIGGDIISLDDTTFTVKIDRNKCDGSLLCDDWKTIDNNMKLVLHYSKKNGVLVLENNGKKNVFL